MNIAAARLESVLARIKHVRRSGNGHVGCCPAHDDCHPSLSIRLIENAILLHCFVGCSLGSICKALGICISDLFACGDGQSGPTWTNEQRREYAWRRFWKRSGAAPHTTIRAYFESRGIVAQIPSAIRFIHLLPHREYGWPFPAMVAGIQSIDGKFAGVQITWLCADGSGKAPVEPPRKIYGPYRGGAVRLGQLDTRICVGEGIETMLSVQQATGIPTWAALSATNLPHLELPPTVPQVVICADRDEAGEMAAQTLARRLTREGREARIARPSGCAKDFNDLWL